MEQHDWKKTALFAEEAEDLYEHAPCGYLSLLPDGLIGRVNATFLELTGFSREELVGRLRFLDLLTIGGRIFYETHFQPLLRMQGSIREIAFDLVRSDGARLPALVNATQYAYPAVGALTRITVFDATDRRRYERELLLARDQAEEAARQRSELIATISHDVRGPLSAMVTAIALLERTNPTPDQARYIRVLQSSTAQALELVTNVLDLSRLESGGAPLRERPFSVRELVRDLAASARASAVQKPDVEIVERVEDAVPDRLLGDRPKLAQAVANLMMNAVKFTHRGVVSLLVSLREGTPDSVSLEISVSDTGIGIPSDRLPHIFEEFTQATDEVAEQYGGTGLGLAISRRLLRLYDAELHVTSAVGQGTTFSFVLTLKRRPEES
jgi:PAS domain S-box-containing protein